MSIVALGHHVQNLKRRFAGFGRNDLDYAPFGAAFLKGLTPARLAIVALVCAAQSLPPVSGTFARFGISLRSIDYLFQWWAINFTAAIPLLMLIVCVDRWTQASSWKVSIPGLLAATILGSVAYSLIRYGLVAQLRGRPFDIWVALPNMYMGVTTAGLLCAVLFFTGRERDASRRLLETRLARVATERQLAEARLQLLRAQIEPHFLFNSLASVKRLYEEAPEAGRSMLHNMSTYLRGALGRDREKEVALGSEIRMAQSFLDIFQRRMGDRLAVTLDVPSGLEAALIPPLVLGTLLENAVKHGISPRASGGSIAIRARVAGGDLVVDVIDNGVGFREDSGTGVGLANTRARLLSIYGPVADLDLKRNERGGVTASIRVPLRYGSTATGTVQELTGEAPVGTGSKGTFFARFLGSLTAKHWAWAAAIGAAVASIDRIRGSTTDFDRFTLRGWADDGIVTIVAACLFMLGLVAAEASNPASTRSFLRRYFLGWLAASVTCVGVFLAYPFTPAFKTEGGLATYKRLQASPNYNMRVFELLNRGSLVLIHGTLGCLIFVWLRNSQRTAEALTKAEIERAEAARKLVTSQVEAVQAEVDPTFVFRTLEDIERTYQRDPREADAMLDELIAFLRAAIPKVRGETGMLAGSTA